MPTFGDYETVGDPIAVGEERGNVSTVWRAVKPGASDGREYVVKRYASHQRTTGKATETQTLSRDRGLEFLEGIKAQKKAQSAGGRSLAPIHDFGMADTGVWYVTDFYSRDNLKAWIARKGRVDSAGVRHVVAQLVTGCLALKRSRGYSHGNVKVGNAFRAGKKGTFHQTPILLTDPYPAGAVLELDARNLELLGRTMEAEDLRAIGEILLQLVEGRLLISNEDYNWPIALSPAWRNLGKDGERWLQLCNQLLDPNRSPEALNLETLAKQYRPSAGSGKLLLVVAAVVVVVGVVGGGIYALKAGSAKRGLEKFNTNFQAAQQARASTNLVEALAKVNVALSVQPENQEAQTLKNGIEADIARDFASAISSGNAKLEAFTPESLDAAEQFLKSAEALKPQDPSVTALRDEIAKLRGKLKQQGEIAASREELKQTLEKARTAAEARKLTDATNWFGRALILADKVQDPEAAGEARQGLKQAQQALDNLSEQDRRRSEIDELIVAARTAGNTNGWQATSNHLNRALELAQQLGDSNRVKQVTQALQDARTGASAYLAQKANYDQFEDWMKQGKAAADLGTADGLKTATNSYNQAQILAPKLNHPPSLDAATQALQLAIARLNALLNRNHDLAQFTSFMEVGAAATRTNGWASAAKAFSQALDVAKRLGESDRRLDVEAKLKDANIKLEEWSRRQQSVQELTKLIDQAKQEEGSKAWESASNSFYRASIMAGQLSDPRSAEIQNGLKRAKEAIDRQAQEKQWAETAKSWMDKGRASAATNGWAAAKDFYAKAVEAAKNLPERTLQSQAETEYTKVSENLAAEILNQQRQAAYKLAMTSAREKLGQNDYQGAIDQADVALKNMPNDPAATKLSADAKTKLDAANAEDLRKKNYAAAMVEAKRSYQAREYATAKTKAEEALGLQPDDPDAKKLRDDAQAMLEQQTKIAAQVATLDSRLQDLMKQFKVKGQGASILPDRSGAKPLSSAIPTDDYLKVTVYLRNQYKEMGLLEGERQKCLDVLEPVITRWNSSF